MSAAYLLPSGWRNYPARDLEGLRDRLVRFGFGDSDQFDAVTRELALR